MAPLRSIRFDLAAAALAVVLAPASASGQSLIDRVQGLYFPPGQGTWDCTTLGMDGGAVGIHGNTLHGVENACTLTSAFPLPGMDAMIFDLMCQGEGTTYDGGKIILIPTSSGLGHAWDGFVTTWERCP